MSERLVIEKVDGEWPDWAISAVAWSLYTNECEPVAPAEFCPGCGQDAIFALDELLTTSESQLLGLVGIDKIREQ